MTRMLRALKAHYRRAGRGTLPWRNTRDPYKILVSEVMLQQTQVARVLLYYPVFIKRWPTAAALAAAPLAAVLRAWQGLGYNRRAQYLHEAARIIAREGWRGQKLPGVGPYTAAAVAAFAHNKPVVFIETNIRTVFTHHFFPGAEKVHDKDLLPLIEEALVRSGMPPREFYSALMDYGSHLKKSGVRLNSKSAHYTRQSAFEGSRRQKRARALRQLLAAGAGTRELKKMLHAK